MIVRIIGSMLVAMADVAMATEERDALSMDALRNTIAYRMLLVWIVIVRVNGLMMCVEMELMVVLLEKGSRIVT